jgi:hypothetical protein
MPLPVFLGDTRLQVFSGEDEPGNVNIFFCTNNNKNGAERQWFKHENVLSVFSSGRLNRLLERKHGMFTIQFPLPFC